MKLDNLIKQYRLKFLEQNEIIKYFVEVFVHFQLSVANRGKSLEIVHDQLKFIRISRTVFPNRQKTRKPNEIVHKKFILSTEQYDFGPLVLGKDINKYVHQLSTKSIPRFSYISGYALVSIPAISKL
jgi:hypothetical protein